MKKALSILLLAVMVAALLVGCSSTKSPTDVAKDFMSAWEKQDKNKVKDLMCSKPTDEELNSITAAKIDFSGLKYKEQNKKDKSVTVQVTGTMKMDVSGTQQDAPLDLPIPMEKKDGKWCIVSTTAQ